MKAIGRKNLSKLRRFMENNKLDAILFCSYDNVQDVNIRYFTGFFQEEKNHNCKLLITLNERILFVSSFDFERAKMFDVEKVVNIREFNNSYTKAIRNEIKDLKRIGINKEKISVKIFDELKKMNKRFFDVSNFISELRSIKLRKELELINKSVKITNKIIKTIEEILGEIRKRKIRENEIVSIIKEEIGEKGETAFPTIVASNKRSAFPHPFPSSSKQKIGKIGFIDFGVSYKGYCTDVTVLFVSDKINTEQRKIVSRIIDAYNIAVSEIKEGVEISKVYEKVNNFLKQSKLNLSHSLGHGIGLEVHEKPSISEKSKGRFKRNMVFTIEPAVYLKNFGVRIENDFLLKKRLKVLTHAKLIEI